MKIFYSPQGNLEECWIRGEKTVIKELCFSTFNSSQFLSNIIAIWINCLGWLRMLVSWLMELLVSDYILLAVPTWHLPLSPWLRCCDAKASVRHSLLPTFSLSASDGISPLICWGGEKPITQRCKLSGRSLLSHIVKYSTQSNMFLSKL